MECPIIELFKINENNVIYIDDKFKQKRNLK